MPLSRRSFLTVSLTAAAGAHAALAAAGRAAQPEGNAPPSHAPGPTPSPIKKADKPLKVLFLGGTVFLGPHTVERLLVRGHTITLFNRGKSNPELFPDLEKLRGDRGTAKSAVNLSALEAEIKLGRRWDVVIDTCAYVPRFMRASTELLKTATDRYIMIASINVYTGDADLDQDESAPVHTKWPQEAAVTNQNYGPMKRGCEAVLEELMPGRWASARPALIVGPRDPSDRFSYWPVRSLRGGEILAPVGPEEPAQFIDARDLAALLVLMAEKNANGPFNAVGAPGRTLGPVLGDCLAAAKEAGGPAGSLTWAPLQFLTENQVQPWSDLPAWVPSADPESAGAMKRIGAKSSALGATFRPTKETAADILKWWASLPEIRRAKPRSGLSALREMELLKKLHG
ncbi:MAG: hypothetical protein K2Q09_02150 [Phycisphaerales bacterium]|nr:hypothetical protein [Phycisphaerales bacterium]